jgi:hypothetical protein
LAPTAINFGSRAVGTTSSAVNVVVTSSGEQSLAISTDTVTGDFAIASDTCKGGTFIAGRSCTIGLIFKPKVAGIRNGTLSINDNAINTPQIVQLTGIGGDFSFVLSPTSASVTAGSTANTLIDITPVSGYTQTVTLTCLGAITGGKCTIAPNPVPLNGSTDSIATMSVTTSQNPALLPTLRWPKPGPGWFALLFAWGLSLLWLVRSRKKRLGWVALAGLSLALYTGCGTKYSTYTPAGSYTITVKAQSGNIIQTQQFALTVQ